MLVLKDSRTGKTAPVGTNKEQKTMPTTAKLSPTAVYAMGTLGNYLAPRLAQDQKVDLRSILLGTTAKNLPDRAAKIARDVKRAVRGRLAQDADVDDVEEVIDAIQEMAPEIAEAATDPGEDPLDDPDDMDVRGEEEGRDSPEMLAKALEFLKDKLSPEDINAFTELMGEENVADPDETAQDKDDEDKMNEDADAGVPRGAMDGKAVRRTVRLAVDSALAAERERQAELREAERFVRPIVGDLGIACDSADEVYAHALQMRGISKEKVKAMPAAAYRPLLEAMQTAVPRSPRQEPALAVDAKPSGKSFRERFPGAANVKVMG